MKKILLIMLVGFMSLSLVACGGDNGGGGEVNKSDKYEGLDDNSIYLVTDIGTIDDKSFNQGSW